MNQTLKTVTIKTDRGPVRINESAYDPEKHALDGGETPPAPPAPQNPEPGALGGKEPAPGAKEPAPSDPTPPAPPAPEGGEKLMVVKKGKKFVVVDGEGKAVERDGLESSGYDAEQAAWDAILALK